MTLILLKIVAKPLRKIIILLLMLFSVPAFSLTVGGLYSAQVSVKDQSTTQVLNAKKLGLAQVLVKVTGQSKSLNNAKIRAGLAHAEEYLQSFSFTTQLTNGQPQAMMELAFDKLQVNQLISDASLPIWGADRAAVLVWLVEDMQGTRQIVNDDGHPMVAQIMSQADQRGMPLLWPLLDLEDQVSINGGDLWGVFKEPIENASHRYQPDAVLIGRMFLNSRQLWRVEWNFWLDDVEQQWSSQGADLAALVEPLQDRLSSSLVAKFALSTSIENQAEDLPKSAILRVGQVIEFEDYVELQTMLQGIAGVQSVQLYSANGSTLEFIILVQSQLAQVKSIIDLKRNLRAVNSIGAEQGINTDDTPLWHYQWN
tara:strand:- start:10353 stop:11459 length:1107 start_codon:yes stop_codon:yes gene_type:complete